MDKPLLDCQLRSLFSMNLEKNAATWLSRLFINGVPRDGPGLALSISLVSFEGEFEPQVTSWVAPGDGICRRAFPSGHHKSPVGWL